MQNSAYLQCLIGTFDAKTTGAVLLDTTENGNRRFYPLFAVFEIVGASAIVGVPTISIGTNSSTFNNILAAMALTGLSALNKMIHSGILNLTVGDSIAPNTAIKANVTVAALGTTATLKVMLFGFYD